jgi:hypothetical protein
MAVIMLSWFYMVNRRGFASTEPCPSRLVGHGHVFDSSTASCTFGLLGIAAFLLAETLDWTLICFDAVFRRRPAACY